MTCLPSAELTLFALCNINLLSLTKHCNGIVTSNNWSWPAVVVALVDASVCSLKSWRKFMYLFEFGANALALDETYYLRWFGRFQFSHKRLSRWSIHFVLPRRCVCARIAHSSNRRLLQLRVSSQPSFSASKKKKKWWNYAKFISMRFTLKKMLPFFVGFFDAIDFPSTLFSIHWLNDDLFHHKPCEQWCHRCIEYGGRNYVFAQMNWKYVRLWWSYQFHFKCHTVRWAYRYTRHHRAVFWDFFLGPVFHHVAECADFCRQTQFHLELGQFSHVTGRHKAMRRAQWAGDEKVLFLRAML